MRRPLVIEACSLASVLALTGLAGGAAADARGSSFQIQCQLYQRASVTHDPRKGPVFRLSAQRHTVSGRTGAFGFRATAGTEPGQISPAGLSMRVWSSRTGKPVLGTLHQFRSGGPRNEFAGGHGFTGLVYAYLPGGDELQYFCRVL
jgi:hypothetical protein